MNILVTGVTGTLGSGLIEKLYKLSTVDKIIGFSRDELKQSYIKPNKKLKLLLGDLRDEKRVVEISKGIDLVFHVGALKRIDTLEINPFEAVKTNIVGTYNICHAQKVNNIRKIVLTSTDKACYPVNVYGATKMISERLILENPNNVITRWGNVIGSRGSLIPILVDNLKHNRDIELTHEAMERYWIKIDDAVNFLIKVGMMNYNGVQIPHEYMKQAKVKNIIKTLKKLIRSTSNIYVTKIRPGEKIIENMITSEDKITNVKEIKDIPFYSEEELERDLINYM